uniref:Uncharacterized protein n=1 Tax=Rhizophora mucronata TaxID=61149 RepID=A0A2P2J3B4_RHIMU
MQKCTRGACRMVKLWL